jgi:hypothetical protein
MSAEIKLTAEPKRKISKEMYVVIAILTVSNCMAAAWGNQKPTQQPSGETGIKSFKSAVIQYTSVPSISGVVCRQIPTGGTIYGAEQEIKQYGEVKRLALYIVGQPPIIFSENEAVKPPKFLPANKTVICGELTPPVQGS